MRKGMSGCFADLHIHTNYSDSTDSPEQVVTYAAECGLSAISITDHDTIDGLPEACAVGERLGVEIISGVELSSEYGKKDIHILGYFFDLGKSPLVNSLSQMQEARVDRMKKMVNKLVSLGVKDLNFEEVASRLRSDAVGRLHLAQLLVEKGAVKNLEAAFRQYLSEGAPAYFPKFKQTPFEAIKLIKDSGGVAVMAHPMVTQRDELIPEMVRWGLDGIEAYYPNCSMEVANFYIGLAEKHGLIITGGSDAHGKGKTNTYIGKAYVDYASVEKMKVRCGR